MLFVQSHSQSLRYPTQPAAQHQGWLVTRGEEVQPICPNQLLIGKANNDFVTMFDLEDSLPKRTKYVEELLNSWWDRWYIQVFPHLLPCRKWQKEKRNLKLGDICQLFYPGQYKLCKVTNIYPDEKGLLRTVEVSFRRGNKRKPKEMCKSKLIRERVGVQRLCLLVPAEDENQGELGGFDQEEDQDLQQSKPQDVHGRLVVSHRQYHM